MTVERLTIVATVRSPPFSLILTGDQPHASVWSNFEIGDLDFWRGEAYTKFVEFLDEKGGFYYEVRGNGTETLSGARNDVGWLF